MLPFKKLTLFLLIISELLHTLTQTQILDHKLIIEINK